MPNELQARKYSVDQLSEAKRLFLGHKPLKEIEQITGIKRDSLRQYAYGKRDPGIDDQAETWLFERRQLDQESFEALMDGKHSIISEIGCLSLELIRNCLKAKLEEGVPPSISEAQDIAQVFSSFDKIMKLDLGKPTENVQQASMSLEECLKVIKEDPLSQKLFRKLTESTSTEY